MIQHIICIIALLSVLSLRAQDSTVVSEIANLKAEDYTSLVLPPLNVLLENARQNAAVEFYNSQRMVKERELKTQRRTWLKYIKIGSSYQYGLTNDYSVYSDASSSLFDRYSGKAQHWYSVGVNLSLPLDEIFDRSNRIKQQKLSIQAGEFEIEKWYDEQSLRIIDVYTMAVEALSILQSRAEAATIATAQYKRTEMDFIHGKATAQQLSMQKNIESTTVAQYEQTRSLINNALLKLEILSKTKIINK